MSKRAFDFLAALFGLVLISPILLFITLAIRLTTGGPIFYRAYRVGREGKLFRLYKFRTMIIGADKSGPGITQSEDQRITATGKWLRKYKLDELPQLFNVLKGEMSLVGPRPEDPRYVCHYTPEQRKILQVRPGITSMASLEYRDEASLLTLPDWERVYVQDLMPDKLRMELDYLHRQTFFSDLKVLFRTVMVVFK